MKHWFFIIALVTTGCRGKDNGGPPIGAGSGTSTATAAGAGSSWSTVVSAGKQTTLLGLASGPLGSVVVVQRDKGSPVVVNGNEVVAGRKEGEAFVHLDAGGKPNSTHVFYTGRSGALAVGRKDVVVGVGSVSFTTKGAIATLPGGAMTAVDGNVGALARTESGDVWVAGNNWGSEDPLSQGKCDRNSFLARRIGNRSAELVLCDVAWTRMQLASAGEDVVFCASQYSSEVEIGTTKLNARTFLARFGSDGALRWARAVNELGNTSCESVAVTSDGDIVAVGAGADNANFTEGAVAKGMSATHGSDEHAVGTNVGTKLWLARFSGDGTRRWARAIGEVELGGRPTLDADRNGNALLAVSTTTVLDLGHGPVGPDGGVILASIDRDAKVTGLLKASGGGDARAVVDAQNGVVFALILSAPASVAGFSFEPSPDGGYVVAIVRVPLPLPAL